MRAVALALLAALLLPGLGGLGGAGPNPVPSLLGPQRMLPILVAGDLGFLGSPDLNGVRGGIGSADDPYRIEGWSIVSLPFNPSIGNLGYSNVWLPCILVQNTRMHLIIRDNLVRGNNCHGIWLQNASNVVVERNLLQFNTGHGIFVDSFGPPSAGRVGHHITIRDNVVKGNGFDGVRVFYASDVRVERNLLVANANFGLLAREAPGVRVLGNTADYNEVSGLFVEMSDGAIIHSNVARNNAIGLDLEMTSDASLRWNVAQDNRDVGIYTSEMSMNTVLEGNLVERNGLAQAAGWNDGMALNGVMETAIRNTVRGNRDGISLGPGSDSVEVWNNIVEDNERGIVLEACPCEVMDNTLRGNGVGIAATVGGCKDVMGNNLQGNALGASSPGTLDMHDNWWGSPLGPQAEGNPGGDGDAIAGAVLWNPFLAEPNPAAP